MIICLHPIHLLVFIMNINLVHTLKAQFLSNFIFFFSILPFILILSSKIERRRHLGIARRRVKDNIKVDVKD